MFDLSTQGLSIKPDRRHEPRYTINEQVAVHAAGHPEQMLIGTASVRDVSKSGACLEMNVRILPDTVVELRTAHALCRAVCRHSSVGTQGYLMGFQLIEDNKSGGEPVPATW